MRIFGPPGCGKTTFLSRAIGATARARGSESIIAASFTTTAAAELAGRDLPIPKRQVGTLHSLAYRAIDTPRLVVEELDEWNKSQPALALSVKGGQANVDDGAPVDGWTGATDGDALLGRLDILRARMVDPALWPKDVHAFAEKWSAWKAADGLVDFTDLIDIALHDVPVAPGAPEVGVFDETQDFSALELALVRAWGKGMERIVLAGDDDQALFRFRGATPDAFLNPPVPDIDKRILSQSYRVPAAVHAAAEAWVRQLSRREPKEYLPREERGSVDHLPMNYKNPGDVVDVVEEATADGSTAMILATCAYMLDDIKNEMRRVGLPFHNPWRRTRGDWNPLGGNGRGVASKDRLLAYLIIDERMFGEASRLWTGGDVARWAHCVKTQGVFVRGAKGTIENLDPVAEVPYETLATLFADDDQLDAAVTPDLAWFKANLLAGSRPGLEFPITVAERRGGRALLDTPLVSLGTIHSAKGAEADTVVLFPDLSFRGSQEWAAVGEPRDSVVRQMYVGMTRARRRLIVCDPLTGSAVSVEQLIAGARKP